jgi:diaminopimelate epimerase
MAAPLVGRDGEALIVRFGRAFYKMTGSGNDFVFFDATSAPVAELETVPKIQALCAPGTGVGADGVVFLDRAQGADFQIRYYNRDGSRGELCGNASLCTARLAVELGLAEAEGMAFLTDAGLIGARIRAGLPEIDLQRVTGLRAELPMRRLDGEHRMGFVKVGVPHVVILHDDAAAADVDRRGRELRWDPAFAEGANVNFVSPRGGGFAMRTFERGVEAETLACGTGAVATAVLLANWGAVAGPEVEIQTSSGRPVYVHLPADGSSAGPSLRGEGRIVFRGRLGEV